MKIERSPYIDAHRTLAQWPASPRHDWSQIGSGSEGIVSRVPFHFPDIDAVVPLAFKRFKDPSTINTHLAGYHAAKIHGFPVPSFYITYQNGILMPDLSDGGDLLVFSTAPMAWYERAHDVRLRRSLYEAFMRVDMDLIFQSFATQFQGVDHTHIALSHPDCFFMRVCQDGFNDIILGDFFHIDYLGVEDGKRQTFHSFDAFCESVANRKHEIESLLMHF